MVFSGYIPLLLIWDVGLEEVYFPGCLRSEILYFSMCCWGLMVVRKLVDFTYLRDVNNLYLYIGVT